MNDCVRFSWSEVMYLYNFTETVVVKHSVSWNSVCPCLFLLSCYIPNDAAEPGIALQTYS